MRSDPAGSRAPGVSGRAGSDLPSDRAGSGAPGVSGRAGSDLPSDRAGAAAPGVSGRAGSDLPSDRAGAAAPGRRVSGRADADRPEWAPCSDRSRERDDPLAATASRGLRWFLVEIEGPWGANAFASSSLGRELGQRLVHRIEAAGLRPLAIRQPQRADRLSRNIRRGVPLTTEMGADVSGERAATAPPAAASVRAAEAAGRNAASTQSARAATPAEGTAPPAAAEVAGERAAAEVERLATTLRRPQTSWRWAFVDSRPGFEQVRWGAVNDPHELLEVALDGSQGILSPDPVFCVCTHAKHDQCCAVHGRPVMTAIAAAHPDQTWECSHLGGDRFAGTMVIFPEGLYYGHADDTDAIDIVRRYGEGLVDERFFRGRSALSHPVQAAQHYARTHFDDHRLAAFEPLAEVTLAPDAAPSLDGAPTPDGPPAPGAALSPDGPPAPGAAPSPDGPPTPGGAPALHAPPTLDAPAIGEAPTAGAAPISDIEPTAGSAPAAGDGVLTRVTLAVDSGSVDVVVAETRSAPLLSTCSATRFGRVREYRLVSLG